MYRSFVDFYEDVDSASSTRQRILLEDRMLQFGLAPSEGDLDEMAMHEHEGKKIWDIPKCPIFFDDNDIWYLRQFPPWAWRQAMSYRYNDFPIDIKKAVEAGKKFDKTMKTNSIPRWRWIDIYWGSTCYKFFVDTRPQSFWTKMTKEFGAEHLRDLDIHPTNQDDVEAARQDYFNKYGAHGFTFDDYQQMLSLKQEEPEPEQVKTGLKKPHKRQTSAQAPWVTRDYVGQTRNNMSDVVDRWLDATQDGWLGDAEEKHSDAAKKVIRRGSGARTDAVMWCRTGEWVANLLHQWRWEMKAALKAYGLRDLNPAIKSVEDLNDWGIKVDDLLPETDGSDQDQVRYKCVKVRPNNVIEVNKSWRSYIPVMFQGKLVDAMAHAKHQQYRDALDQAISVKSADDESFNALLKDLCDAELDEKVVKKLEQVEAAMQQGQSGDALMAQLDYLAQKQATLVMRHWLEKKGKIDFSKVKPDKVTKAEKMQIVHLLGEFENVAKEQMKRIVKDAKRYEAFDWLMAYHNAKMDEPLPGKKKQRRRFPRLYLSTHGFGTLNPNKNQKGMQVGNPDDWGNTLNQYVGTYQFKPAPEGKLYNYVVDLPKLLGSTPSDDLPDGEGAAQPDSGDQMPLKWNGAIIEGIIRCLKSSYVKGQPEYFCLLARLSDVLEYCKSVLAYQTGAAEMQEFIGSFNSGDIDEIMKRYQVFEEFVTQKAHFLTLSLFQLPFDPVRGSIRVRSKASKAGAGKHVLSGKKGDWDEADIGAANISDEDKEKIKEMADQVVSIQSLRTYRAASSGWEDFIGMSIPAMYDYNKEIQDQKTHQVAMQNFGFGGQKSMFDLMSKLHDDVPLFIFYRSQYIADHPEDWNPNDANQYAYGMLLQAKKGTGIGQLSIGIEPDKEGKAFDPMKPFNDKELAAQKKDMDDALKAAHAKHEKAGDIYKRMAQVLKSPATLKLTPEEKLVLKYYDMLNSLYEKSGDTPDDASPYTQLFNTIENWVVKGIPGPTLMHFQQQIADEEGLDDYEIKDEWNLRAMFEYVCKEFGSKATVALTDQEPEGLVMPQGIGNGDEKQQKEVLANHFDHLVLMYLLKPMNKGEMSQHLPTPGQPYLIPAEAIAKWSKVPDVVSEMKDMVNTKTLFGSPLVNCQMMPVLAGLVHAIEQKMAGPVMVMPNGQVVPAQQGQPAQAPQQATQSQQQPPQAPPAASA